MPIKQYITCDFKDCYYIKSESKIETFNFNSLMSLKGLFKAISYIVHCQLNSHSKQLYKNKLLHKCVSLR